MSQHPKKKEHKQAMLHPLVAAIVDAIPGDSCQP
jgi:hypothetical protein